jgi:hypothetical protein
MFYGLANKRQILDLATLVCTTLGSGNDHHAVDMLVETCAAETLLGAARDGTLYGAGAGVAQTDEGTFDWLKAKHQNRSKNEMLKKEMNIDLSKVQYRELDNSPALSLVFCRLRYLVVPEAIPDTREGRAVYWKKHYNSSAGKGSPQEFLHRCKSSGVPALIGDGL